MNIPYNDIIIARSQYHDDLDKYNVFQRAYLKIQYWFWKKAMLKSILPDQWKDPKIYKEDISAYLRFLSSVTYPRNTSTLNIQIGHQYMYEYDLRNVYDHVFYVTKYDLLKNTSSRESTTFVDGHDGNEGTALFMTIKLAVIRYIMGENDLSYKGEFI